MSHEERAPGLVTPVGNQDHGRGPASAPVTLVLYGDFQCPFTSITNAAVQRLRQYYGERLRTVFRHFPRTEKHRHAQQAAEAAEAAGAQGKFWEMHDYLFESQFNLDGAGLERGARRLGLDEARFENEVLEHVHAPRIRDDVAGGMRSGVRGTPTIFINGFVHEKDDDFEFLVRAIDKVLAAAKPHFNLNRSSGG